MTADAGGAPGLLGLSAARVLRPDGSLDPGVVWIDPATGTITDVVRGEGGPAGARPADVPGRLVDLGDHTLAPGFVDVHVHGGAGHQANGDAPAEVVEALRRVAAFHVAHGTTSLVATSVSDSVERLAATVAGAAALAGAPAVGGARILGSHLEGPFLSPARPGAQDPGSLRTPTRAELARLLDLGAGTVRLVTLAPELPGAVELIADCLAAGAIAAVGHTDADYDEARRAFDAGATHVAHLFNAMAPLHHRSPGLVGAALLDERVSVELVCDLHHVHPAAVELVARLAPGRLVLVTDAGPAAGLPPGVLLLGGRQVVLDGTRVALASDPDTLAGSVLTMERAVRHAVLDAGVPLAAALAAASSVPASLLGGHGAGSVEPGAVADLVVLDGALEVAATLVAGVVVHDVGVVLA